jgi:heme oxygenase
MAELLAARLPRARYTALLHDLRTVYAALEAGLAANAGEAWLAGIDLDALRRCAALDADLAGESPAEPTAVARAYAARLQALAAERSPLLLAHVYSRYLGDLHGGQILQRLVSRHYPGIGTRFYEFGPDEQVQALRRSLRAALAAAPLDPGDADRVVAEARWSFEQHIALFEALAAGA